MKHALRHPAIASFLLALLLRVGFAAYENARSGTALEWPDEELHWQIARNLAQHNLLASDDGRLAARMPLYPMFLAPFAAMGPDGIPAARIVQAVLAALVAPLGTWMAGRAFGRRSAWLAAILLALDPYAVYFAARLLTEALFSLIAIALIAAAWRVDELSRRTDRVLNSRHIIRLSTGALLLPLIVGPLAAAAILIRQSSVAWVALLLLAAWWMDVRKARATMRLLTRVLTIGLLLSPWGMRNLAVLGDFAWLSANGGVTLYDAQGPQADGSSNQAFLKELPQLSGLDEIALDRELQRLAIEQMQRDPARVMHLAWVKFLRMWNPLPNVAEYRGGAAAWAGAVYTVAVLGLALVAAWRELARHTKLRAVRLQFQLWLPVVLFTLMHCMYIGSVRYRVPLMPMLAISAAGIVVVRSRGRAASKTAITERTQ